MKILILSCNTGQGHNAAGKAVLEELIRQGADCLMMDALSLVGETTSRRVSGAYCGLTTHFPRGFQWLYRAGGALSSAHRKSPVYLANLSYAGRLKQFIEENGYDTVVMPHLFPAEALTYLRKKEGLKARCYAVATDYTCIPFWEETELDRYFIPHEDLTEEFVARGIAREKLIPTGIPVSERFNRRLPQSEARSRLGLPQDEMLYLVMTGSMGFGNTADLTGNLLALPGTVCVLGGNNEKMKASLRSRFGREGRVRVLDFTDRVALYMDACDMLFTKPGGLTSTEAAVKNVPLIHTAPIPGCETINARF
ncbi:MAG: glycosyl transferase, partial [Oscillospiraceae bacterium]|nr:glycosyl transferase [Oscillospiraceae bacterium]